MRVFDCVLVTASADLDLLEARMTEFADLPVTHVIAEATADHQGRPKPLHFAESELWRDWHGRWTHVRVEAGELPRKDPRARKDALREYLAHGVSAEPGDIILHGGIDEIPGEETVRALLDGRAHVPTGMEMRWCAYTPRKVHPLPWYGTVAQQWRNVGSFAGMRDRKNSLPAVVSAGTRLSMLGEEEQETHPDGHALWACEVDETWPKWVREKRKT